MLNCPSLAVSVCVAESSLVTDTEAPGRTVTVLLGPMAVIVVPVGMARIIAVAESVGELLIFGAVVAKFVSHRQDELVLEIPMIPLCSDACPGISPPPVAEGVAREENGIDPRLSPLLRLKKK